MPLIARIFLLAGLLLALALTLLLVLGSPWDTFSEQGAQLLTMIWGRIALLDLYAGFFLALALVWRLEPHRGVAVAVSVTLPLLGNPVLALWLLLRWRSMRLTQQP